jgi:HK97 gp10 family phage protein
MPDKDTSFEMGGLSTSIGFLGLKEFAENLQKIYGNLSGIVGRNALQAGAEVFRSAIQSATPIGKEKYEYTSATTGKKYYVKPKRKPGTAKAHVIIYERKKGKYVSEGIPNLLVGYEKKYGYWMYWYEYGTKRQAAKPFMRPVFDANYKRALDASAAVLSKGLSV